MNLVVDANLLFSFFRDNPVRFIILNSPFFNLQLFSPAHVLDELNKNIPDLIKHTKLSSSKVESIIRELKENISIIPPSEYRTFESKAKQLSPHRSNKDIPYFALALKLDCAIWSNEPSFKQQSKVKILNTKELKETLNSSESSLT